MEHLDATRADSALDRESGGMEVNQSQTQTSAVAYAVAVGRHDNRVAVNSLYETREALFTAFRHTEPDEFLHLPTLPDDTGQVYGTDGTEPIDIIPGALYIIPVSVYWEVQRTSHTERAVTDPINKYPFIEVARAVALSDARNQDVPFTLWQIDAGSPEGRPVETVDPVPVYFYMRTDGTECGSDWLTGDLRDPAQAQANATRESVPIYRRYFRLLNDTRVYSRGTVWDPAETQLYEIVVPEALPVPLISGYSVVRWEDWFRARESRVFEDSPVPLYTADNADAAYGWATQQMRSAERVEDIGKVLVIVRDYQSPNSPYPTGSVGMSPEVGRALGYWYPVYRDDRFYRVLCRMASRAVPSVRDIARHLVTALDGQSGQGIQIDYRDDLLHWYPVDRPIVCRNASVQGISWHLRGDTPGMQSGRLVKSLRKLFPDIPGTDADWETFGNEFRAQINPSASIQMVSGDDIAEWYSEAYSEDVGSCMQGQPAHYFDLYARNPEVCRLLIYTDDDDALLARALVWTQTDGTVSLDRCYGSDIGISALRTYARDAGWELDDCGDVQLQEWDFSRYPYVDSRPYLCMTTGILTASEPSGRRRYLHSTDGRYEEYAGMFRVELTRTITETAYIEIEAESEEDARQQVFEQYRQSEIGYYAVGTDSDYAEWEAVDAEQVD